jgi:hypothetical protein
MNEKPSEHLSDFNPLSSLDLPGNKTIALKGLILIVGPNSSGKTQLLKDVHQSILGQPRKLVVATAFGYRKPKSFESMVDALQKEGYVRKETAPNGRTILKNRTAAIGVNTSIPTEIDYESANSWFNSFTQGVTNPSSQQFHSIFGAMLSSALFLSNRLTAVNQTNNYDYETQPPSNDVQALYYSSSAKKELTEDIQATFGRAIWVDPTRSNILCFRVADGPELPSADERFSPDKVTNYRTMDEEGDGLRSFVAICMCLALSRRPIPSTPNVFCTDQPLRDFVFITS